MSVIFVETTESEWNPVELSGAPAFRIVGGAQSVVEPLDPALLPATAPDDVILLQADQLGAKWTLSSRPGSCRVNGAVIATGLKILAHKDEIMIANSASRLLYSDEVIAVITVYYGQPKQCPRCTLDITNGSPIVVCPNCRVAYHQDAAIPRMCFTYAAECMICHGSTALDAGYTWPPEGW